ncbi:GTP-binding protein [Mycena epipterygia]|nr:GTP-binding protein [Mycena epipterygia]
MDDLFSIRSECEHFRILVIGRTNTGKTTLLKKVCNSIEDPEIFGPYGNPIPANVVEGSSGVASLRLLSHSPSDVSQRGSHDIDNQLIFKSNPQYIFHDSCGFESGSLAETNKVKSFIAKHADGNRLSEQLHAIWYCLATDTNRPLLEADEDFFGTDVVGKVPVIAILTKCEAVASEAFQDLLDENEGIPDATLVDQNAQKMLDTRFVEPLKGMPYPPANYVQLKDMQENGDCGQLITKTAGALTDDILRLLFVSVQQNNINLSIYNVLAWHRAKHTGMVSAHLGELTGTHGRTI